MILLRISDVRETDVSVAIGKYIGFYWDATILSASDDPDAIF